MAVLNKITRLNWIASILFPFTAIVMEVLCVYPWLILIGRWPVFVDQHTPMSLASLMFLLGGSFFVTKYFIKRRWPLTGTRLSILACGLASILTVLRIEYPVGSQIFDVRWFENIAKLLIANPHPSQAIAALLVGLYLWWRGIGLGYSRLFFENIYRSFSVGLVAQVVLILAWGTAPQNNLMSTVGVYIAGFFFFGLSALALAKLKGTQERSKDAGGNVVFNGRWLSIIVVVIGAIILVGILFAGIFSTQFLSILGQIFNLVSGVIFKIVYYVAAVAVIIGTFMMAVFFYVFQFIMDLLVSKIPFEVTNSGNMTPIPTLNQVTSPKLSQETTLIIKSILFILVIAGMVFLIAGSIMRHRPNDSNGDVEEIQESLWSWNGFLKDLRLFSGLLAGKFKAVIPERHKLPRGKEIFGRLSIREVYQHMLGKTSQLGIPRRNQETPYEYGKRLAQEVPEGSTSLNEITDMYVKVRYSEIILEDKQVDKANILWQVLVKLLMKNETED